MILFQIANIFIKIINKKISASVANLFEKLWPKYFDSNSIALVNGGINETTELLKQRFDYIFYTGNTPVAKIIASAAVYMIQII
jgi:aldehyde dehydrogenase (NAD+)